MKVNRARFLKLKARASARRFGMNLIQAAYNGSGSVDSVKLKGRTAHVKLSVSIPGNVENIKFDFSLIETGLKNYVNTINLMKTELEKLR